MKRCSGTFWDDVRTEWRWLCPMPPGVHFDDAVTEPMILGSLPPRPEPVAYSFTGCAANRCQESPFAENDDPAGELDRRGFRRFI
jgi:hypothetical protein